MNHSINYSGFVDLVVNDDLVATSDMDSVAGENLESTSTALLHRSNEMEGLVRGVTLHSPNKQR